MKRKLRFGSLVLAIMMSLALMLTGCGNANKVASETPTESPTKGATDTTTGNDTATTEPDLMSPFTPYPETITLTVGRIVNKGQSFAEGETSSDNGMLKLIEKKLNVKFEILWETTYEEYMQKLSLGIASGDLPDIFQVVDQNAGITFRSLASNGALADLTEAYDKCLGGLAKEVLAPVNEEDYMASCYYDGKLYGITAPADVDNFNVLWVRNDWLQKLDLEVPKTIEDIEKVAKQFIANDLGGTKAPIGIAINPDTPLDKSNSYYSLTSVANALGSFPNTWMKDESGQLTFGSIAPQTKDALGVLAKWYQEGIIDKSFITYRTVDEVTPMVNNNQIGLLFAGWWEPWIFADMVSKNPGAEWIPVLAPLNTDGKFVHNNSLNPGINGAICVSSECKYPEAVIKALNVEFDAINGAYDNNPDDFALFKAAKDANSLGRTTSPFGTGRIANNFSRIPTFVKTINDYIASGQVTYDAFNMQDKDYIEGAYNYNQQKDTSNANGVVGYYGHYLAGNLTQAEENQVVDEIIVDYTDSMGDLWPAMDALQKQVFVQIIVGDKPLDYFDEFVEQWKSMGGDIITKEVNDAY
jgi:putative aldouronate transport system substrate-binding protein